MRGRFAVRSMIATVILAAFPVAGAAQSNIEVNAGVQFDFVSPGARSLALGGAFTAIADDATAAFTNPAGLRALSRKEISFEARFRTFETPFTLRGHAFGTPTQIGVDTVADLVAGTSRDTIATPSFISFVYPTPKWAIAAYRHQVARFKSSIRTEGAFVGGAGNVRPTISGAPFSRLFPLEGSIDLKVADYGVSGSYNVSDKASVGGGIVFFDFDSAADVSRFDLVGFEAPNYALSNRVSVQTQRGNDRGIGVNVGVTVQPSSQVHLGAVYRRGAAFDLELTNTSRTAGTSVKTGKFHVPDTFSAGVVVRVAEPLRVALDFAHVQYSQLVEGFVDVVQPANPTIDYSVDDANEVHAGAEYTFNSARVPVAIRGGVWWDPAHALVYTGPFIDLDAIYNLRNEGQVHYAFGAGFLVRSFELHAGVDLAKTVKTTAVSLVARF